MNCGCGEPNKRHQDSDITKQDLEQAAKGGGKTLEEVTANLRTSLDTMDASSQTQQGSMANR
jgi:hypothetical protein